MDESSRPPSPPCPPGPPVRRVRRAGPLAPAAADAEARRRRAAALKPPVGPPSPPPKKPRPPPPGRCRPRRGLPRERPAVRGRGGLDRVGGGRGQRHDERERARRPAHALPEPADERRRPTEATTTAKRSHGCQSACGRAGRTPTPVIATVAASTARVTSRWSHAQGDAADADERADRGRERDRVVRVDDALGEAEHEAGDDEPGAPEHWRPAARPSVRLPGRPRASRRRGRARPAAARRSACPTRSRTAA